MSNWFEDAAVAVATCFSAVAAGLSWWSSRKANETAGRLAAIERDRQHGELRPQLTINPRVAGSADLYYLDLNWTGPDELEPRGPLAVTVMVRDDKPDRGEGARLGGGPTAEEIGRQIWGPWRFRPHVDGADPDGRTSADRTVPVGEVLVSTIERTRAPHWMGGNSQASWGDQYAGKPLRLRIEARCPGFEPWIYLREVLIPD